jgi:hypothetical protein
MKHLISTLVVFTVFAVNALFAELAMRIEYINSEEYQATISSIARWEIDGANEKFRLVALDGTVLAERNLYDDIRRIVIFDDNEGNTVNTEDNLLSISVFPNPTQEMLYVDGINVGETIRIFSLDGQMLLSSTAGNGTISLSVESLSNGVYLLQIGTEIVKFIKQ